MTRWIRASLAALVLCTALPVPQARAQVQDLNAQARQLCAIAIGTLAQGQYDPRQVLGYGALQTALSQTGGRGIYPGLAAYGPATQVMVANPHFDQDQQFGQLFHFYCTSLHQSGAVQWELKYAPGTGKLEYFSMQPAAQQPAFPQHQPTFPQQQQPTFPQQQPTFPQQQPTFPQHQPQVPAQQFPQAPQTQQTPQPGPQAGNPQAAPGKSEACKMFPGMC